MCNLINEATCHINQYKNNRFLKERSREYFEKLLSDIKEVLVKWTGDTYVGCPKEERLQKTYQNFFEALLCLLLFLKEKDTLITRKEKEFYQSCLYNGTLYRYIGSNYYNNEETIKPRFDGIYVSWSKNPENDYLRSKLYGPITWLKCEVKEPMYAIDLNYFGFFEEMRKKLFSQQLKSVLQTVNLYMRSRFHLMLEQIDEIFKVSNSI